MAGGRPKKPLEAQKGNLTQKQKIEMEEQEEFINIGSEQLDTLPSWLRDPVAKSEWKRLVPELRKLKVISNLDYNNLGLYCNAFSMYIQVSKKVGKTNVLTKYTNKSGATNKIINPNIAVQLKYTEEMRKYSGLLGLSIDSRLKIATGKKLKENVDLENEFGDI